MGALAADAPASNKLRAPAQAASALVNIGYWADNAVLTEPGASQRRVNVKHTHYMLRTLAGTQSHGKRLAACSRTGRSL